jgi:hypothetical protein
MYPDDPNQPQPIIIKQETSTGTKVGIWVIAAILGIPVVICVLCTVGFMFVGTLGAATTP